MTELERFQRYTPEGLWSKLEEQGYKYPNLQRFVYNGFMVISTSKLHRGFRLYIYKDRELVKIRNWSWKDDIRLYAQRYIDQCLVREFPDIQKSKPVLTGDSEVDKILNHLD